MAKRIPYKIIDLEALQKAYPEIVSEETIVRRVVDKEKLYKIVKLSAELGRVVDGVEIGVQEPVLAGTTETLGVVTKAETIPAFLKGKE